MGRLNKPKVDQIKGLPAIAVEQVNSSNPRSTMELRQRYMIISNYSMRELVKPTPPFQILKWKRYGWWCSWFWSVKKGVFINDHPTKQTKRNTKEQLDILIQQRYARIYTADGMQRLDDLNGSIPNEFELIATGNCTSRDEDLKNRLSDTVDVAFLRETDSVKYWISHKERTCFSKKL